MAPTQQERGARRADIPRLSVVSLWRGGVGAAESVPKREVGARLITASTSRPASALSATVAKDWRAMAHKAVGGARGKK